MSDDVPTSELTRIRMEGQIERLQQQNADLLAALEKIAAYKSWSSGPIRIARAALVRVRGQ
jgi:hypothetical protein